jgi:hypothetical protein
LSQAGSPLFGRRMNDGKWRCRAYCPASLHFLRLKGHKEAACTVLTAAYKQIYELHREEAERALASPGFESAMMLLCWLLAHCRAVQDEIHLGKEGTG